MSLHPLFQYLPALIVQAFILMAMSRLLFRGMISAFGNSSGRGLVAVLRLPGNILHETAHAIGYVIFGFRVRHIVPCIFDPKGRGACIRGKPWSPISFPWLADGSAAIMPLIVGTVAIMYLGRYFGIFVPPPGDPHADLSLARYLVDQFSAIFAGLEWDNWQTYLFLYLSLTIGAEISPSATDLRYAVPTLFSIAGSGVVALYGARHAEGFRSLLVAGANGVLPLVQTLFMVWTVALVILLLTTAVAVPVTFLIYMLRPDR